MARDIIQRFLKYPEQIDRLRIVQLVRTLSAIHTPSVISADDPAHDPGVFLKLLCLPFERGEQTEIVEHIRSHVGNDTARGRNGMFEDERHRLKAREQGRALHLSGQFKIQQMRQFQFERRQRAAQIIVDLARQPGFLFLAHRLKVRRELAQLLLCLFELGNVATDRDGTANIPVRIQLGGNSNEAIPISPEDKGDSISNSLRSPVASVYFKAFW